MFPYYIRVTFILIRRSVCRSVGVSLRLSFLCLPCVPVSTFVCLSLRHLFPPSLSVCLSTYLPDCLSLCQSICLSVCLSVCVSVYSPSVCLSVYGSVYALPSLCLSVSFPGPSRQFSLLLHYLPFLRSIFRLLLLLSLLKHTVTRFFYFPCSPIRNTFRPGNGPRFCHQHDCCG